MLPSTRMIVACVSPQDEWPQPPYEAVREWQSIFLQDLQWVSASPNLCSSMDPSYHKE